MVLYGQSDAITIWVVLYFRMRKNKEKVLIVRKYKRRLGEPFVKQKNKVGTCFHLKHC